MIHLFFFLPPVLIIFSDEGLHYVIRGLASNTKLLQLGTPIPIPLRFVFLTVILGIGGLITDKGIEYLAELQSIEGPLYILDLSDNLITDFGTHPIPVGPHPLSYQITPFTHPTTRRTLLAANKQANQFSQYSGYNSHISIRMPSFI